MLLISLTALCTLLSLAEGLCGFPGIPEYANIIYEETEIIRYTCPHSFVIDGDVNRTCTADGQWTGMVPRCAVAGTLEAGEGQNVSVNKLIDGNFQSCDWFQDSVTFQLDGTHHVTRVSLIGPITDERIGASKLKLNDKGEMLSADYVVLSKFRGVLWQLNSSANELTIILAGNVNICEVTVHLYPHECGRPEISVNSLVIYNDTHAIYTCDPGFTLSEGAPVRICSGGRWIGSHFTCYAENSSDSPIFLTFIALASVFLLVVTIKMFWPLIQRLWTPRTKPTTETEH